MLVGRPEWSHGGGHATSVGVVFHSTSVLGAFKLNLSGIANIGPSHHRRVNPEIRKYHIKLPHVSKPLLTLLVISLPDSS